MSWKFVHDLNNEVMRFTSKDKMQEHPEVHRGLNSFYLQMRAEIASIESDVLKNRQNQLRELYKQDFLQFDKELRQVDKAFMETQY